MFCHLFALCTHLVRVIDTLRSTNVQDSQVITTSMTVSECPLPNPISHTQHPAYNIKPVFLASSFSRRSWRRRWMCWDLTPIIPPPHLRETSLLSLKAALKDSQRTSNSLESSLATVVMHAAVQVFL